MRKCKKCNVKYENEIQNCPTCGQNLSYPEGNKIAWITLSLMIASQAIGFITGFLEGLLTLNEDIGTIITLIVSQVGVAATVLSIVGFCKYPSNTFCKVLFIIQMVSIALSIIAMILLMIACTSFLYSCSELGLLIR